MRKFILYLIILFPLISFSQTKKEYIKTEKGILITAPIVTKKFVYKNGKESDFDELYIRASIEDYFIKFCESKVSKKELSEYLDSIEYNILGDKVIKMEITIINHGSWDICDSEIEQQSRIGAYAIIHRIIKD